MASEENGNVHNVMINENREENIVRQEVPENDDSELKFGWGKFQPNSMQFLKRPIFFLVVIMLCSSAQVTISELLPFAMFTLKTRFKLSTKDENSLEIVRGLSAVISLIVMGYFGGFRNKIRWIAAGMVMTGLGGVFFALPHFLIKNYQPLNLPKSMLMMFGLCLTPPAPCHQETVEHSYMALFVIGQMLIGAGLAPLYSLVPAYLDENVSAKTMPIYIMVWYSNVILAPAYGAMVNEMFSGIYIDINQPDLHHKMSRDDMRWLGAWWLPYLLNGLIAVFNAPVILGFPERLPGSHSRTIRYMQVGIIPKNDPKLRRDPLGIFQATAALLKNKTYIFNTLALCCIAFYLSIFSPFLLRVLIIKYGTHPRKVAKPFIIVLQFGSLIGLVIGGLLVKRIGLKNIAKSAAFICLVTEVLYLITPLLFVVPGCNESSIAGVSIQYPPLGTAAMLKQKGTSELTATCNTHCKCSTLLIQPVCGSNNVTYFDPCHAGCIGRPTKELFVNCSCIPRTKPGYIGGDAKLGFCDRGCNSWALFLVVMLFCFVILGANHVPNRAVVLRCVPYNQRAYALAFHSSLYILTAIIPRHLIKYIMDKDCNIWQKDACGRTGYCWDYKANSMSKNITIFGFLVTALAMVFYFLSWYFYNGPKTSKQGRLLSETGGAPDEFEHNTETNL